MIPIICGPTASGKSAVAIEVAKRINGEIISADSMQVYRHLDIGTAKVTKQEQAMIPHHLIDCCEPDEIYSVARFKLEALDKINDIINRGKVPIICGGTGLYISAILEGIDFVQTDTEPELRVKIELAVQQEGLEAAYSRLQKIDPQACDRIHPADRKRIIRALEIYELTGKNQTWHLNQSKLAGVNFRFNIFVLNHDREILYNRINQRVLKMFEQGLVEEAKWFYDHYPKIATAHQAIGYKEAFRYLNQEETLEQAIETISQATRRYAKRQLTWFRRYKTANWINNLTINEAAAEIVSICNIS